MIAVAGAALGAAAAWYGTPLMLPFFRTPMQGTGMLIEPDQTVFLVTALSAIATTLFFGALPAWRAARANPASADEVAQQRAQRRPPVAASSRSGRAVARPRRGRRAAVAEPAAPAERAHRLRARSGDDPDRAVPPAAGSAGDERLDLYDRMVERLGRSADIQSAAVTWYTPMTGYQSNAASNRSTAAATPRTSTLAFNHVGAGYFRTMTTKILAGPGVRAARAAPRRLRPERRRGARCSSRGSRRSAGYVRTPDNAGLDIVRGGSGGRVAAPAVTCRVVGIAEDAKFGNLREAPPKTIYFPLTPDLRDGNLVFLLNARTKTDAISGYREALREIAPTVPLVRFVTLREQMEAALGSQRAITFLSTFFGVVALLLSALGLYGMLSSNVSQRTAEIGIRAALGASRGSILRMILLEAARLGAIGAVLGAAGVFFAVRFVDKMLYGVTSFDWLTFLGVGVTLPSYSCWRASGRRGGRRPSTR